MNYCWQEEKTLFSTVQQHNTHIKNMSETEFEIGDQSNVI